jgi:hypothetical protein
MNDVKEAREVAITQSRARLRKAKPQIEVSKHHSGIQELAIVKKNSVSKPEPNQTVRTILSPLNTIEFSGSPKRTKARID